MDIDISINGSARRIPPNWTVATLAATIEAPAKGVAVAVNREVVPRRIWDQRLLVQGDTVDIVQAIGGG